MRQPQEFEERSDAFSARLRLRPIAPKSCQQLSRVLGEVGDDKIRTGAAEA